MTTPHVFVDLDSGTIINGPISLVPLTPQAADVLEGSDSEIIAWALAHGTTVPGTERR